jgi:tRNA1Val (adenine37-N6)-methyltransferase
LLTRDALFSGKLLIYQQEKGYRFSIDAVLLAGLASVKPVDRVVELGSGCGVVLLILAHRRLGSSLLGIEIQEELHGLAERSARENGLDGSLRFLLADWRSVSQILPPRSCELVITNPPYRRVHSGRVNPDSQRAVARHEIAATLPDLFGAASHLLPHGGRLGVIYPSTRLGTLLAEAHGAGFRPKQLTVIFSYPGSTARLVYVQFTKRGGEELQISAPFFIYERPGGDYSEAMRRLYEG